VAIADAMHDRHMAPPRGILPVCEVPIMRNATI
jgi:hypothetical protein